LSANEYGSALAVTDLDDKMRLLQEKADRFGVPGLGSSMAPAQMPGALARAEAEGHDVQGLLADRVKAITLHTRSGSLKGVAAALKAWHGFAVLVLGYGEQATLPPRSPQDVLMWAATFKNSGTAANYLAAVKWACLSEGLDTAWYGDRMFALVKGLAKVKLTQVAQTISCKALLTSEAVQRTVCVADGLDDGQWAPFALASWNFLARVQSEMVPLEVGTAQKCLTLPPGRHSSVYVSEDELTLAIRFQKRKNRPSGSYLRRPCTCKATTPQFCVVHRVMRWIKEQDLSDGDRLFSVSGTSAARKLGRYLTLCGTAGAEAYTLKAFRAGRATEMAALGFTLPAILEAGEWKSRAVFNYVDIAVADHAEVLRQSIEASDDEDA